MSGGAGYTTYFRALDPRIGRWLTPDPKVFPWQSPYVSMDGNPIALIDPRGASTENPPAGASSNPLGEGNEVTAYGKAPQNPVSSSSAFQPSTVNVGTLAPISVSSPTPTNIAFNPENFTLDLSMFSRPEILPEPEIQNRNFYDGNKVAEFNKQNYEKFLRGDGANETRPVNRTPTEGETRFDCSGWVDYVLYSLYPSLWEDIIKYPKHGFGPVSAELLPYAQANGGLRQDNPQVGDLVFWEGHVEFVFSVDGNTFISIGSSTSNPNDKKVPSDRYYWSGTSKNGSSYAKWYKKKWTLPNADFSRRTKFNGFWTPVLPKE